MNNKIRVLNIVNNLTAGGIEKLVYDLVTHIDTDKFSLEICCVREKQGAWLRPIVENGVPVHFLGNYRKSPFRFLKAYKELLKQKKYHVVHVHLNHLSGVFLYHPAIVGVERRIAHFHSDFSRRNRFSIKKVFLDVLNLVTDKYAGQVVGISNACLESVYGMKWQSNNRVKRIYNGVDFDQFSRPRDQESIRASLGIDSDSLVIGHVGRFRPEKNHQFIVDLAASLCSHRNDFVFLLVGDGQLFDEVRKNVNQKGLQEHFVFTGVRTDVPELMAIMDFFILPSLWEGFGLTVIEAQAAGLPVLVSNNVPVEIPLLKNGSKRIPLEDLSQWINACELIVNNKSVRKDGEKKIPHELQVFSIQSWVSKIMALYE